VSKFLYYHILMAFRPLHKQELIDEIDLFIEGTSTYLDINNWDVTNVTTMDNLFKDKTTFNSDISGWNVSQVTDMSNMFENATMFNQPIGEWDVRNVTNMAGMFKGAAVFNHSLNTWNVSNVLTMAFMFEHSGYLGELNEWDVSHVTNMIGMFKDTDFNSPLEDWNVVNVVDMSYMFKNATQFNQPIGEWDVSDVQFMNHMFNNATEFNQPIGDWSVGLVQDMIKMFKNATQFNQPIGEWDVGLVQDMSSMFENATEFNQPIGNWDVSQVQVMSSMFENATNFNQPIGNWLNPGGDLVEWRVNADVDDMFHRAFSFNQDLVHWVVELHDEDEMFSTEPEMTMTQDHMPTIIRFDDVFNADNQQANAPQLPHEGVAFQVHNVFGNINMDALMAIIGPSVEYIGPSIDIFIREQLASLLRELPDDERASLTPRYETLIPCIEGLQPPSLYNTVMDYIHRQGEPFQQNYIRSFIIDSTDAYGEGVRSCTRGVQERLITSMGPAGTGDPAYDPLIRVLSPLMRSQIDHFSEICRTENAAALLDEGEPGEGNLVGKTAILRDCMRLKLSDYIQPADPDPPILTAYLADVHDYLGGKTRRLKRKKTLRKKQMKRKSKNKLNKKKSIRKK
jgi:surface protein